MPDPITILHVVFSLDPGGLENGIVNLSRALVPKGFCTHVFCLERPGRFADRLDSGSVEAFGKSPGFSLGAVWALYRCIQRVNPQVVHTHNLGPLIYGSFATVFGRFRPLLQGEHSQLTEAELTPRRLFQRRWLYRACTRIHTVGEGLKRQLIEMGFCATRIDSIANGVDTDRFYPCSQKRERMRQTLGMTSSARVIGIVGRFGPHKRHQVLIEAFSRLALRSRDLYLLVVGAGGPEAEAVRVQANGSAVAARIHLVGFQERPEDYYRCMDLLVVPSVNEGLSNAVLEAMACAIPVLSHTSCGSSEAIVPTQTGYTADLTTPEAIEEQISTILSAAEALPELGTRARARVMNKFSLAVMAERYSELYRAVAGPQSAFTRPARGRGRAVC